MSTCRHCGIYIDNHNYDGEWLDQPGSQRWCQYVPGRPSRPELSGKVAER